MTRHPNNSRTRGLPLDFVAVLLLALGVRWGALVVLPADTKPWSDGMQYVNLGASMADGKGYRLMEGNYWPGQPTIVRAPGWPLVLSGPFRFVDPARRLHVSRITALALDSLNALLVVIVALGLGAGRTTAAAAGMLYAVNPVMAGLCALSASEPLGVMFILLFLWCCVSRSRLPPAARCGGSFTRTFSAIRGERKEAGDGEPGAHSLTAIGRSAACGLLIGLSALVRMNWLLIAPLFGCMLLFVERRDFGRALLKVLAVCVAAFIVVTPWIVRNSVVFGRFPVLGAGGGEMMCGGNNDLTAEVGGVYWGYMVQPGGIPGEPPLAELAGTMDENEVDRYYMRRGLQWIRANPGKLPGLLLGKLVRAYLPWPRSRTPAVIVGTAYRWGIYILAALGVVQCWLRGVRIRGNEAAALVSVILAHLVVVVIFAGVFRYVIASEILLCLPAAAGMAAMRRRRTFTPADSQRESDERPGHLQTEGAGRAQAQ